MSFLNGLREEMVGFGKEMEGVFPRKFEENTFDLRWKLDLDALDGALAVPVWDLLDRGGKRWRPFLMRVCCEVVGGKVDGVFEGLMGAVELIHNGTLMVDDIEDSSELRRGRSCVHRIYGEDVAINAGNGLYFLPMISAVRGLEDGLRLRVLDVFLEEMGKLHFGQGLDIVWHNGDKVPSVDEYLQMCAFKTGTLARMAARFGGILGGADDKVVDALGEFAESLGVAFQIQDDVLNVCSGAKLGKGFGDDVTEGKMSLLVIRALEVLSEEEGRDLVGILGLHTRNGVLVDEAVRLIGKSGAVEWCKGFARDLVSGAWGSLDGVLEVGEAKDKLKGFVDFVVEREF
jgi:geranylgeranyl diphosphate synthase type I